MPIKLLIADDHDASRTRLAELLNSHAGWEVCAAVENGEQAVAKAIELRPDIVILDLAMPVMNGIRAAREIRQALGIVPIVMYSFHGGKWLELEAKKAGARKVIAKPNVELLMNAIEDLISKEPGDTLQETMPALGEIITGESKPESIHARAAETSTVGDAEIDRAIGDGAIGDPPTPLK